MSTVLRKLKSYLIAANQWFKETPDRALDQAYKAALMIKAIEDEYFDGKKISSEHQKYRQNAMSYFDGELKKHLNTAKVRLAEFKTSTSVVNLSNQNIEKVGQADSVFSSRNFAEMDGRENPSILLEKLKFIDEVLAKYTAESKRAPSSALITVPKTQVVPESRVLQVNVNNVDLNRVNSQPLSKKELGESEPINDQTSFVPRSILSTLDRLKRDLDPKSEEEVVKSFRTSQAKTVISIKFILLLILVPLLTQQVAKNFVAGPVVDRIRVPERTEIFLNMDLEEEAFKELQRFEELLKFKNLVSRAPHLSQEEIEEQVRNKAISIEEEYRDLGSSALKNVIADIIAAGAVALLLTNSKREIAILKSFIDEVVYGLSDSAKAFIIILFTDVFVGFHSPHGWEVVLEGISKHLGLPENRDFNFLFIATFPVILDTIFKYWIFRYLNRISPSAVATYRNMNE